MRNPGNSTRKERPSEQLQPDQSSRLHQTPEAECASYARPIVTQWALRKSVHSAPQRKDGRLCFISHP